MPAVDTMADGLCACCARVAALCGPCATRAAKPASRVAALDGARARGKAVLARLEEAGVGVSGKREGRERERG